MPTFEEEDSSSYSKKAEKIAEHILNKEKSRLKTMSTLDLLATQIRSLAELNDSKINNFPDSSEPPEYNRIRQLSKASQPTPEYPENKPLRRLAEQLLKQSEFYYNTHKISENYHFISDEDDSVTPSNFFSIRRITEFVRTLADDQAKYRYLLQMKRAFLDKDERGFVRRNKQSTLKADDDFMKKLEDEIAIYERTQKFSSSVFSQNKSTEENSDIDEIEPKSSNLVHITPRNQKQVFLALEIILRLLNAKGNKTEQGKFMSFISGFSAEEMRKSFSKSEGWKDKEEDLKYIRQLCIETKFTTLKNHVDSAIKEIEERRKN